MYKALIEFNSYWRGGLDLELLTWTAPEDSNFGGSI